MSKIITLLITTLLRNHLTDLKIKDILLLLPFLLYSYSNVSFALGIGEITVKSHLGEPLSAEISITDVEKTPDINCFSITDLNAPPAFGKSVVALRQYERSYQLSIRTHEAIIDPILNLHLVHNCNPSIIRDYVILLDPPQHLATATNNEAATINSPHAEQPPAAIIQKSNLASSSIIPTGPSTESHKKKQKKSSSSAKASSLEDKLNAIYTGSTQTAEASRGKRSSAQQSEVASPRLRISGSEPLSDATLTLPQPALRLETQIDLTRTEELTSLSTAEVMDEITSIDNRLALMKSQITSLQDKNEKLKLDAEQAKTELEDTMTKLRIAAGLIALLAFVEWMRRKIMLRRAAKYEKNWLDSSAFEDLNDETVSVTLANKDTEADSVKDSVFNDAFHEKSHYGIATGFGTSLADNASMTDANGHDNEDILESIDVLVEYGRYQLAIQILHDYLSNHPAESPRIWLKLIALIAEHGTEADYGHTREKCTRYYRIKLPSFAEASKSGTATLEDFPFIVKELESAWGSAGAVALLDDLIYDRESQPQEGFEPEIFEQLFLLKQIAENHGKEPDNLVTVSKNSKKNHHQSDGAEDINHLTFEPVSAAPELAQENEEALPDQSLNSADTSRHHSESKDQAPQEKISTLDFDSYFTQNQATRKKDSTEASEHYFVSEVPEPDTLHDNHRLDEAKSAFNAPAIDFSQHIKAIGDTLNTPPAESAKKTEDKPPKRISKDSNLIDWVISDES